MDDSVTKIKVNPARAGMIPSPIVRRGSRYGKPRASGDNPEINRHIDDVVV